MSWRLQLGPFPTAAVDWSVCSECYLSIFLFVRLVSLSVCFPLLLQLSPGALVQPDYSQQLGSVAVSLVWDHGLYSVNYILNKH